jgi:hypothetical protein
MSNTPPPLIPIYTSKGDAEAFLLYPYLFNRSGDWIGFVTPNVKCTQCWEITSAP